MGGTTLHMYHATRLEGEHIYTEHASLDTKANKNKCSSDKRHKSCNELFCGGLNYATMAYDHSLIVDVSSKMWQSSSILFVIKSNLG